MVDDRDIVCRHKRPAIYINHRKHGRLTFGIDSIRGLRWLGGRIRVHRDGVKPPFRGPRGAWTYTQWA